MRRERWVSSASERLLTEALTADTNKLRFDAWNSTFFRGILIMEPIADLARRRMAELMDTDVQSVIYWDRKQFTHFSDQMAALKGTKVVYIGNLSFHTTEPQIHECFSQVGTIKRVIMGLNRFTKEPCGFCFVEYFANQCALDAVAFLHGTTLDQRIIRVELDWGYHPSRRYGRGESGGQVRDEKRTDYDAGRGGYGRAVVYSQVADPAAQAAPAPDPVAARRYAMKTDA